MTDFLDRPRRPGRISVEPGNIAPEGAMRVPVRLLVRPGLEPPLEAIERLRDLASLPFLRPPAVAMPDVHPESTNPAPTGIVLATSGSLNHGAGRLLEKADAIARWTEEDVARDMAARRVRLYRGGTMNVAERSPRSFQSVTAAFDAMRGLGVAAPIARLRPVAVLKG